MNGMRSGFGEDGFGRVKGKRDKAQAREFDVETHQLKYVVRVIKTFEGL
jgi:hypothetical protein